MDNVKAIQVLTNYVKFFETMISRTNCNVPKSSLEMIEACTFAVGAIGKQIANPVKVKDRQYQTDYYCPRCGKQQKAPTYTRLVFGSFCERCGQCLSFPDPKTGKAIEVNDTTFVFEF